MKFPGGKEDMERTLVLVKPDGVQRGLIGSIISRLEQRGLKLVGMKLMHVDGAVARQHYSEHVDRPFMSRPCFTCQPYCIHNAMTKASWGNSDNVH